MVQAELEKTLTKNVEDNSAQNGQENPLVSQLSNTVGVLDSIISELRLAQDGNKEDNAMADQLISSLSEIRGNTIRRNPVIVWQNPRILLNGRSIIKEPERPLVEEKAPVPREETRSQLYYKKREQFIAVAELSGIIGVPHSKITHEATEWGIEISKLGPGRSSHLTIKDAQRLADHFAKKKLEDCVFGGIEDESISIQEMAGIVNTDVGSVLEVSGRLSIPIEKHGHQRLINRKFAKQIKALTEQRTALERLARYSQQDEDSAGEIKDGYQIVQQETEIPGEYISTEQFYKTIGMIQTAWSRDRSQYPEVRTIRNGRFKFFSKEDAEKVGQINESKKAERETKKEKSKKLTALPEGYISQDDFLKIVGINNRQYWHQIKNRFPVPTMLRVGRKIYYLKTDADLIKAQIYLGRSTQSPRTFTDPKSNGAKPAKTEQPALPVTISEFAAKHNLEIGKILEIAGSHFNWGLNEPSEHLSPRQQKLLSFYIESNLKTAPEGFMTLAQVCKELGIANGTWYNLKLSYEVSSYRVNGLALYKKEDVERVAKERQQRANERMAARLERKPQFDKEFEEMMEGSEEQDSRDLDLFGLHLAEIGQIPLEVQKHKLWAVKISNGQLAVRVLENLLNFNLLDSSQKRQIEQILDTSRAKYFLKQFKLLVESKLAKTNKKTEKISPSDKKFFEVLKRHDSWFDRLKANSIPQVVEHQIKLFNLGSEAFDNLVTSNMRLVVTWAKKYLWSRLPISDLKSYGDEGLMKAAVRFDWRRDTKFSTYATSWIKQSIGRGIADYSDTIRVPVHVHERISKFKREADELLQKGEDIDMEKLASEVDPTGNLAKSLRTRNLASLSSAVGPDQDSFLEDFLEDVRSSMDDTSDKIGMREALMEALDTLAPRERKVLMLRYGLEDGKSMSLDHVAAYLVKEGFARVTRERIRQIESKALLKLRHPSRSKKLRPYLDDDPKALIVHPGEAADVGRTSRRPQKNPIARVFSGRSIARSPAF